VRYPKRGWLRVAWRELWHIQHSSQALLLTLILPLTTAALMALIFGASVPRALPVVVVDLDHSSMSRQATRMINANPGLKVAFQDPEPDEGFRRVKNGDAYALVLFPQHLERDVIKGKSPSVGLYVNNQMLLPGSLVSRDLRSSLGTLAAGVKIQVHRKLGESRHQAMDRYDPVRLEAHALFNPELDYRCFLVPALVAALLQIFAMFAAIRAFGREIKVRSAGLWFRHSGSKVSHALFGKMLPYAVIHSLLSLVLLMVWHGPLGNPHVGSLAAEWLALSAMGWGAETIALFFVGWTSDYRLSLSMGAFFGGPAMAFAGVSFPSAAMNGPALGWSSILPLTHTMRIFIDQSLRGASLNADLVPFLALAGLPVLFTALTWKRWVALLHNRAEWGQS